MWKKHRVSFFLLDRNIIFSKKLSNCLHFVSNAGMTLNPGQMPHGFFRPCILTPSMALVTHRTSVSWVFTKGSSCQSWIDSRSQWTCFSFTSRWNQMLGFLSHRALSCLEIPLKLIHCSIENANASLFSRSFILKCPSWKLYPVKDTSVFRCNCYQWLRWDCSLTEVALYWELV